MLTDKPQKIAFEKELVHVMCLSLQSEVEAKLRAVIALGNEIRNLRQDAGTSDLRQQEKQARGLLEQIQRMQETNCLIRDTLAQMEEMVTALITDLAPRTSEY